MAEEGEALRLGRPFIASKKKEKPTAGKLHNQPIF
jgi:hypothetical protein